MNEDISHSESDTVEQALVAYLDGELDDASSNEIERRLSRDPKFRDSLRRLQAAWDMLDLLPRADAGDEFTKSTVELVAVKATNDARKKSDSWTTTNRLNWIVGIAGAVVALFVGYGTSRYMLSAPNRQLVSDLPVIENVDLYHNIDSIEFLQQLDAEGLFAEEAEVGDAT